MLKMKRSKDKGGGGELRRVLGDVELPTIPALVTAAIEQVSSPDCNLDYLYSVIPENIYHNNLIRK